MALKVIGAGFGRTGTLSTKQALEHLGFAKCYHMLETARNPHHARVWHAASLGEPVDWDALFEGYQAAVDWPASAYYQELMRAYPDAKVVLTVRDPEAWYRSMMDTIYQVVLLPDQWLLRLIPPIRWMRAAMVRRVWAGQFEGRLADRDYAVEAFNQHIEDVKRTVPAERLLIFDVRESWEPLCAFLDVPVPQDRPFPHVNDRARMKRVIGTARVALRLAPLIQVGIVAALIVAIIRRTAK